MTINNHEPNWHDLTGFQRDLLKTLAGLERHSESVSGQDLCRQLEADGLTNVNNGRLYPSLDMLVDGPVAGGNSGVAPVERCGSCEAQEMIANAN